MKRNILLNEFFQSNSNKIYAYILKMTGNRADADDCFQDCFLKYGQTYPEKLSLPLLYSVARSVCIDSIRKNKRYQENTEDSESSGGNPETDAIENEKLCIMNEALKKLPPDEREIIAMAGAKGLKYKEIAEITGLSTANVKVKVHRIREKLRKLVKEAENGN